MNDEGGFPGRVRCACKLIPFFETLLKVVYTRVTSLISLQVGSLRDTGVLQNRLPLVQAQTSIELTIEEGESNPCFNITTRLGSPAFVDGSHLVRGSL